MNTMLALLYKWYQKLTQPKRDIQYPNTQTNNDFEIVNMNDIEMTLNDYVQVGLYKGLCYIPWYTKKALRNALYALEHMPDLPPLHMSYD